MKNKKYQYEYTEHIVVSEDIMIRLKKHKRLLKTHSMNETLEKILDNWEYNVPLK